MRGELLCYNTTLLLYPQKLARSDPIPFLSYRAENGYVGELGLALSQKCHSNFIPNTLSDTTVTSVW